jgi:cytochrome c oxidase assembly protein subunit 15
MWLGYGFIVPFAVFSYQKIIMPKLRNNLLTILAFGGLQGAIGWWMVKSGLK